MNIEIGVAVHKEAPQMTPEEVQRMKEFIAEWHRTHPPVPIFCTPVKITNDHIEVKVVE